MMLLFDENNLQVSLEDATQQVLSALPAAEPTEDEVKSALKQYYVQAVQKQTLAFSAATAQPQAMHALTQSNFLGIDPGKILDQIKSVICAVLDGNATDSEITQAVLSAISAIIPGGILVKTLAGVVVKYLLSKGITAFCELPAAQNNGGSNTTATA